MVWAKALWSANAWMNVLAKSSMFLSAVEENHRLVLGKLMVNSYASLAAEAVQNKKYLFRLRPKFHLLHHCTIDTRKSNLNCDFHATWMDENNIKLVMRIKKQVHKKCATESTLRRFMLGLRTNLNRGLETMGTVR